MSDWTFDKTVNADDSRPVGPAGHCTYCRAAIGSDHKLDCVVVAIRRLAAAPVGDWQPIDTYREGDFVTFWFPDGESGIGGMEMAMSWRDDDGVIRNGWTHGGPNSGSDFSFHEPPTMWCRNPNPPPKG